MCFQIPSTHGLTETGGGPRQMITLESDMHSSSPIHLFLNIEGVVCPRGSAGVVLDAVDSEALQSVWCRAKPLEDKVEALPY